MPLDDHSVLDFPPFRLDWRRQSLSRDGVEIPLRPKTWSVLCHLLDRRGELVGKNELLDKVWADLAVTEDTLTQSIHELRIALDDDARKPRFIETVHRRGFRFIAPVDEISATPRSVDNARIGKDALVGRDRELRRLGEAVAEARHGNRVTVFVTGEAGIGKTSVIEAFLESHVQQQDDICGIGHCLAQYGPKDGFLPVLDALERAFNTPAGRLRLPQLAELAPNWTGQMPRLAAASGTQASRNPTAALMLREIAIALEILSAKRLIVLVLEDLHWSDASTIDLLSLIAQRREPARLLIIGTYRPADAAAQDSPVREVMRDLRAKRRAREIALDFLSADDVHAYLVARLGLDDPALSRRIHQHTDGNPLFVNALIDDLQRRGWLNGEDGRWVFTQPTAAVELPLPDELVDAIATQLFHLPRESQAILEVASLFRGSFCAAQIAATLDGNVAAVESSCEQMADEGFLVRNQELSDWIDGSTVASFSFRHALYQRATRANLTDSKRRRLHQRTGEALESTYGERASEIATDLAGHFQYSGDRYRALHYLSLSATKLLTRGAAKDAVATLDNALLVLAETPESKKRLQCELELREQIVRAMTIADGYTAPRLVGNLQRSKDLCAALGDRSGVFEVAYPLWIVAFVSAEAAAARERSEELERLAAEIDSDRTRLRAGMARGMTELWSGNVLGARDVFAALPLDATPASDEEILGEDPTALSSSHLGHAYFLLGKPTQGRNWVQFAIRRTEVGQVSMAFVDALNNAALCEILCGDFTAAREYAERCIHLSESYGFSWYLPVGEILLATTSALQSGSAEPLANIKVSLQHHADNGSRLLRSLFDSLIGEAYAGCGQWQQGLEFVDAGIELAATSLDRLFLPELWRVRGELLIGADGTQGEQAEACFRQALALAQQQGTVAFELRAAMSLVKHAPADEQAERARKLLEPVCGTFDADAATSTLNEARILLRQLEG